VKIKLDENLPVILVEKLAALGHDTHSVTGENLSGCTDLDVWRAAQEEERLLITQDLDFSDIRRFKPGTHAGLLLVRLARPGRTALASRVYELFLTEDTATWAGCFVVASEVKLRIHRPDPSDKEDTV